MTSRIVTRQEAMPALGIKAPVKCTAAAQITLSGLQTIDGYVLATGDRVLVTGQSTASQNGIYIARQNAWDRAPDWNRREDVFSGVLILDQNSNNGYQATFDGDFIVDTTDPVFTVVYGSTSVTVNYSNEYEPGYTYARVDNDTFTVAGVDATNIFTNGQRVRISKDGADVYGTVASSSFSVDTTTVNLIMEGAAVLALAPFQVFLTTGTAWSPIADVPAITTATKIATGEIGGTQYWVLIANGTDLFYSTNAGLTWTECTVTNTETLWDVAYDSGFGQFYVVGSNLTCLNSTDGINFGAVSVATFGLAADDDLRYIAFNQAANFGVVGSRDTSASTFKSYSCQLPASAGADLQWIANRGGKPVARWAHEEGSTATGDINYVQYSAAGVEAYTSGANDTTGLSVLVTTGSILSVFVATSPNAPTNANSQRLIVGLAGGGITIRNTGAALEYDDGVTFSSTIRAFAYSELHDRLVAVGDSGMIGYIDAADWDTADAWTFVANGAGASTNLLDVAFNETDGIFVAVGNNGVICRSTNGVI